MNLNEMNFSFFRRCILEASRADSEKWYFSQTRNGYFADYRVDYPRITNAADFYIFLDQSSVRPRLTMYQTTAAIPTIKQYSSIEELQLDLKNMEI